MDRSERDYKPNIYQRVIDILSGRKPDRLPFIGRLELWYSSHCRAGTLPEEFCLPADGSDALSTQTRFHDGEKQQAKSLTEVHRSVGMGQELMVPCFSRKLHGVELIITLNDEPYFRENDPVLEDFPRLDDIIPTERPGVTHAEFITPLGKLTTQNRLLPNMIAAGTIPYMEDHILKEEHDYRKLEFILIHSEFIPRFESIKEKQNEMGEIGFVVPMLNRSPFQQLLLNLMGEIPLFYMLRDSPGHIEKIMAFLDERFREDIRNLAGLDWPYVEFDDNLDGVMTNPRLFEKYCLPYYNAYTDLLHGQGKKVGSHTDGNIKPLLGLLAESGLDVCESFTPFPGTECTFEEALGAWRDKGPIIWGGIPSPLLEERTNEEKFQQYTKQILGMLDGHPIILGVGDMVMGNNLIERVRYIAQRVEKHFI